MRPQCYNCGSTDIGGSPVTCNRCGYVKPSVPSHWVKFNPCGNPTTDGCFANWKVGGRRTVTSTLHNINILLDTGWGITDFKAGTAPQVGDELELVRFADDEEAYCIIHPKKKEADMTIKVHHHGSHITKWLSVGGRITVKVPTTHPDERYPGKFYTTCTYPSLPTWMMETTGGAAAPAPGTVLELVSTDSVYATFKVITEPPPKESVGAVDVCYLVKPAGCPEKKGRIKVTEVCNAISSIYGGKRQIRFQGGNFVIDAYNNVAHIKVGDEVEFVNYRSGNDDFSIRVYPASLDTLKEEPLGTTYKDYDHLATPTTAAPIPGKETHMNGKVYNGQVIRTRTVQAGEGVSAGVQVSDVLFSLNNFVASSDAQAQLVLGAAAARDPKLKDVKFDDPVAPIEVRVQAIAA